MSRLVDELKKEHGELVAALNQIKTFGIATIEGQRTLCSTKSALLAHLNKEEQHLYPALRKAATSSTELQRILSRFGQEMDQVGKAALAFFAKYEQGGPKSELRKDLGIEFGKDFGKLVSVLKDRIWKEE